MGTDATQQQVSSRVITVPNALSALRLVGVPVFLWAILTEQDTLAILLLVASGITDYLDGKIARQYGLVSRVGQLLDPVADRLYIITTLLGLAWREIIPWWLVAVLLAPRAVHGGRRARRQAARLGGPARPPRRQGRDVQPPRTRSRSSCSPTVTAPGPAVAEPVGWAFVWWGTALYWLSGILYALQLRHLLATRRVVPA